MTCLMCMNQPLGFSEVKRNLYGNRIKIRNNLCDKHYEKYQKELVEDNNKKIKNLKIYCDIILQCANCELIVCVFEKKNNKTFCSFCSKKFRRRSSKSLNCNCRDRCPVCNKDTLDTKTSHNFEACSL